VLFPTTSLAGFSSLTTVDVLRVQGNAVLPAIDLPALTEVTTTMYLGYAMVTDVRTQPPEHATVAGPPNLTSIGTLSITGSRSTALVLPNVETVGTLTIDRSPDLASIDLSGLTTATTISVDGEGVLAALDLSALDHVDGSLVVTGMAAATVTMPALTTVGAAEATPDCATPGLLAFFGNPATTTLSFPALVRVADVNMNANPQLATLSVPLLVSVEHVVNLTGNAFAATTLDAYEVCP
jgi:hypothetical protein